MNECDGKYMAIAFLSHKEEDNNNTLKTKVFDRQNNMRAELGMSQLKMPNKLKSHRNKQRS